MKMLLSQFLPDDPKKIPAAGGSRNLIKKTKHEKLSFYFFLFFHILFSALANHYIPET